MKRNFLFLVLIPAFLFLLTFATNSFALPAPNISIGQHIYFTNGPGNVGGGEYGVRDYDTDVDLFKTFCIESNEYLEFGKFKASDGSPTEFHVGNISTYASQGGSGGAEEDPNNLGSFIDPLSEETAYLYHHFYHGTLTGYDHSETEANLLQQAIWYFEDETPGSTNKYTTMATNALNNNEWSGLGDVRVINLTNSGSYKQDVLVVVPVPEPTTILLSGLGLLGMAAFMRRRFGSKA